jgi:hypothetical protein
VCDWRSERAESAHGVYAINSEMTPIYVMKDLDLAGKYGRDAQ